MRNRKPYYLERKIAIILSILFLPILVLMEYRIAIAVWQDSKIDGIDTFLLLSLPLLTFMLVGALFSKDHRSMALIQILKKLDVDQSKLLDISATQIRSLSEVEQQFLLFEQFETAVQTEGLQYYLESSAGDNLLQLMDLFKEWGIAKHERSCKEVIGNIFGGSYPHSRDERSIEIKKRFPETEERLIAFSKVTHTYFLPRRNRNPVESKLFRLAKEILSKETN